MRRTGSASIEIGRDGVRGLCLSGPRRQPRVTAWAEQRVDDPRELEQALGAVAERLDPRMPLRLLLSGADAKIVPVDVPASLRGSLRGAVVKQLFGDDRQEAEGYLLGLRQEGIRLGLRRRVSALLVRREPLETWCGLLAAMGFRVTGLVSPGALALAERPSRSGTTLWIDLSGARTGLTLLRDGHLVEERSLDKPAPTDDEPIATVEARLEDVRAIDQLIRDSGGSSREPAVDRLVICGATPVAEPLYHQLREPYEKLGLDLDLQNPWNRVSLGRSPPPPQSLVRLTACLRLARAASLPLEAVPRRVARSRRVDRAWTAAAAAALVALLGSTAWMLAVEQRRDELLAARERTRMAVLQAQEQRSLRESRVERQRAPDWAPLLIDVGHLARPGVDYRKLVLAMAEDGMRIGVAGSAEGDDAKATAELIGALHEQLLTSPYRAGLPSLAAASSGGSRDVREVRFALEETIRAEPDAGEER
jgi:hypothetical protein